MESIAIFKSLWMRIQFFVHGFLAIYLGARFFRNGLVWIVSLSLLMLLLETCYIFRVRKSQEHKYFWLSGFFYILTIIPIICIFDLGSLGLIESPSPANAKCMNMTKDDVRRLVLELGLIYGIILGRWVMPRGKLTRDQLSAILFNYVCAAADILELKVDKKIKEPGRVPIKLVILAAFTLATLQFTVMPLARQNNRTQDVRDSRRKIRKISTYSNKISPRQSIRSIPNDSSKAKHRRTTISDYPILSSSNNKELKENYISSVKRQYSLTSESSSWGSSYGVARKQSRVSKTSENSFKKLPPHKRTISIDAEADNKSKQPRKLDPELVHILVPLLMHDGPFLVLRLVMLIEFSVSTEMHVVFMVKNAMVCALLVYRLCILTCRPVQEEDMKGEEADSKLHNLQLAVISSNILHPNAFHSKTFGP